MRTFSLHKLVWTGVTIACIGLAANMGWSVWDARERAYATASVSTDNLAGVLRQHAERIVDSVEMLLNMVARELGPDSRDPLRRSTATAALASLTQRLPYLVAVRVLDGSTRQVLYEFAPGGPPPDLADVEAMQVHGADPFLGLHVGRPVEDPATGQKLIAISWRIGGRDGVPGNVVVAHLALRGLHAFYATLNVGSNGTITIARADGAVIAHHPKGSQAPEDMSGSILLARLQHAPVGHFQAEDRNGIVRVFSYHRLKTLPLAIAVGIAERDVTAAWTSEAGRDAGLTMAVMAILLAVGHLLTREISRRDQAELALRSSEKRLRMALQAGRMVAWDLDPVTGIIARSKNATQVMGREFESAESFLRNVHAEDRARVADALREVQAGQAVCVEYRYVRRNGDVLWLEVRADQVGEEGGVRCVSGVTFDVTERRRIEQDLRIAKEAAERAQAEAESGSRAKTEFLAAMSHEIRTPLNSIMGFTDLLMERGDLTRDARRQLGLIRTAGSALLTVVNDVLDFSKIEAGAVEIKPHPFSPCALAEDCISIVREAALAKGLAIVAQIDPAIGAVAVGDQPRIRQVLLNLLNNAIKFTEAGSVTLTVARRPGAGQVLLFSIADTGIGIPLDKQERLFQRFSQVDGSYARQYGGTGLGLAISKHLVTLMGGEIGLSSEAGSGSVFWFTIPESQVREQAEGAGDAPERKVLPARRAHLLLVEDSEINQEIARAVLEQAGHRVDVAANGAEAVALVEASAYDLVLMDVQMPVMDGLTATRHIRRLPGPGRDVPIVAMTANVYAEQVALCLAAGMNAHLGKPFDRGELIAAVERWIGGTVRAEAAA